MSVVFRILGAIILLSACVLNPWVAGYWRIDPINFYDVLLQYFLFAACLGLLTFGIGFYFPRWKTRMSHNINLVFVLFSVIILSDRLFLAILGLPLWVPDMDNRYRHRAGAVRSWGPMFENKLIRTNRYGHHDDDFPVKKSDGEFRMLMLGDSVTMGLDVTRGETYSNQLESMLQGSPENLRLYRVINAGVKGYSAFQELSVLKRSLIFNPDMVAVGFSMNGVQKPFMNDLNINGDDISEHNTNQVFNYYLNYLMSETGYGRLIQKLGHKPGMVDLCSESPMMDVMYMCSQRRVESGVSDQWDVTLSNLDKIYDLARAEEINIVLLVFPHTFQLMNMNMKYPQRILADHAEKNGVDVLDFTSVFEELISKEEKPVSQYFMDFNHYTVEGHSVVASAVYRYMADKGVLARE